MKQTKTRYMNATISRLEEKLYRIDVHSSRRGKRIRRTIKGTLETAKRAVETIRQREHAGKFRWPSESSTTIAQVVQLVVDDYRANSFKSLKTALSLQRFWTELAGNLLAE